MIEMQHLKNVVIFIETTLGFVVSRKMNFEIAIKKKNKSKLI